MAYEMTGKIKKIFDQQDFPSGFYKQEFVVTTTEDRFPQDIKLDCLKEKVEMLKDLKEGDEVKVSFDIRGREWNERFYVDLSAWKIEPAAAGSSAPGKREEQAVPAEDPGNYSVDEDDDIPF